MTELPAYGSPRISSELPDCATPLTFDTYSKCSMHCRYCFARKQKDINPCAKKSPLQAVNPEKFFNLVDGTSIRTDEMRAIRKHFFIKRFILHWGGLADAFCHYERKYGVSYTLLEGLMERKYPMMFSSKGPAIVDDNHLQLFEKYKEQNNIVFQFSIITADDKLAKIVEPGVPSPTERFRFMKVLTDMGYTCILRLRPFIIGVTDASLAELMQKALENGASAVSTEFYAVDMTCIGTMRSATESMASIIGVDDIFSYFKKLSPSHRGSYLRLNRLVKEPYIKYMYKFCAEHNMTFACSDPDFKELCTTGICCGIPEEHPNKEIGNWNKHQWTNYIKEARRLYHKTGELMEFTFDGVFKPRDWIFDDPILSHQDINCTMYPYAMRKQLTLRHILQSKWNRPQSPASPAGYFDGKVIPVGLDDTGNNLLYRYNPSDYEKRWADEGIDLTL